MTEQEDDAFVHGLVMRVRAEFPGAEPSDLVSARILAAARARGHTKKWWQHPGVAAAAMLVIVAGAVLWGKKGGEVAEPTRPAETQTTVVHPAPAQVPAAEAAIGAGSGAGSASGSAAVPPEDKPEERKALPPPPPPPPPPPERHVEKKPDVVDRNATTSSSAGGGGDEEKDVAPQIDSTAVLDGTEANDQAAQLTRQARSAARTGQCDAVKMLAGKVKKLDVSYYNEAFANDPDIRRCQ